MQNYMEKEFWRQGIKLYLQLTFFCSCMGIPDVENIPFKILEY